MLADETPLGGSRIDVGRRIGWLLRTARQLSPTPVRLQDIADHAGVSVAVVHRAETGAVRSGRVASSYEEVLGLAPGTVRAPIDILCRTFAYSPADRDPGPDVTTVAEMSALLGRVRASPHGGDWLAWARAFSGPAALGLPVDLAASLLHRLVGEMDRSVASAYTTRYEALALMRCGPYGEVMLDVARERLAEPHVQFLADLMSAVGEHVSPDALAWCLELLRDPRDRVVTAACLGLENMASISGDPDFWSPLVRPLLEIYNETEPDSEQWRWLSHVLRLVPPAELSPAPVRPVRALAPGAQSLVGMAGLHEAHWHESEVLARSVTSDLGLREQPMLARLVHDIVFGPHETRAVTGYMLLTALPDLAAAVADEVVHVVEAHPDPVIRDRAGRRLPAFTHAPPDRLHRWVSGRDERLRRVGLRVAGTSGVLLPDEVLIDAIRDGDTLAALAAAGLSGHALVARLADDESLAEDVRGAAAWWLRNGTRVVDPAV
ncbi:hypothetical protein C7S10_09125 [Nocardioides currus]|uniref:Uncharacterized protein n=1 Tax=Nocardioides currus TaxID=2133958 RepID=A0A2R7YXU1_9ACTN|nr:hypothetical protein C7S10_09125 [Nocardioides currus]